MPSGVETSTVLGFRGRVGQSSADVVALLRRPGADLARLAVVLRPSWTVLGPSWGALGADLGRSEADATCEDGCRPY